MALFVLLLFSPGYLNYIEDASVDRPREGGAGTMTVLGQKVKELRVSKGMTQQRLAEKAEVSHSLISALESGRRKYVSAQDIERLAKALDVPSNDLWKLVPGGKSEQRYIPITGTGTSGMAKSA